MVVPRTVMERTVMLSLALTEKVDPYEKFTIMHRSLWIGCVFEVARVEFAHLNLVTAVKAMQLQSN